MFDSIASAGYASKLGKRTPITRFYRAIWLLNGAIWSLALFRKAAVRPNADLIAASVVLACLGIPMVSYTVLRMSTKINLRESWIARRPIPPQAEHYIALISAIILIGMFGALLVLPERQSDKWRDIGFPFLCLFMAFGDSNLTREAPDQENRAETQRRWAYVYRLGRAVGSLFSTSLRNNPST